MKIRYFFLVAFLMLLAVGNSMAQVSIVLILRIFRVNLRQVIP